MLNIPIFTINWETHTFDILKNINVDTPDVFIPKYHIIAEVVKWQKSISRAGTASARNKSAVSGTGKKPFAQKGRGMARQGSLRNPHQRGGGVAFPPSNRIFKYKINKQKRHIALKNIFYIRLKDSKIKIINNLIMRNPSSRLVYKLFKNNLIGKTLFVDQKNLYLNLSVRNLKHIKFINIKGINTLDFIRHKNIIISHYVFLKIIFLFRYRHYND